jgi:tRNA(Ile)-lysidine synthase
MEERILQKLRQMAEAYRMFPSGSLILTAVSGGADSMFLLHALLTLRNSFRITVAAAHFNHQLRDEAAADEDFVRNWCAANNVPFYSGHGDVTAQAAANGTGIEETARTLRYAFLTATAEQIGAERIATAHHADDNAETILHHLIRGSGLHGLTGIAPIRGKLIRPLLTVERREIEDYLTRHHIPHVEDATNQDTAYTRNYLRQEILPRFKALNPNLAQRLWESACQFRREDAYLDQQARSLLGPFIRFPTGITLPCSQVNRLPDALAPRGVQLLAQEADPQLILATTHRQAVLDLCRSSNPSGQVDLPGGWLAQRTYDRLELIQISVESTVFDSTPLALSGVTEVAGWRFVCVPALCPVGKYNQPRDFYLRLPEHAVVTLRPRSAGDAITLPARPRKTIKKLLIDAKVPRRSRDQLPVFDWDGVVCALTEFGADQAFLPQPGEPAWHITVESLPVS